MEKAITCALGTQTGLRHYNCNHSKTQVLLSLTIALFNDEKRFKTLVSNGKDETIQVYSNSQPCKIWWKRIIKLIKEKPPNLGKEY